MAGSIESWSRCPPMVERVGELEYPDNSIERVRVYSVDDGTLDLQTVTLGVSSAIIESTRVSDV